jgi:hypothetical protein
MSLPLQVVLGLAVVTLTVFLVLLLVQARRTAAAVERLADSATRDLRQMAEDIHEVRRQVDEVAGLARSILELPSALTQVLVGLAQAVPAFFRRERSSSVWIDSLLTAIQTALHLFRRPKAGQSKEASHE